MADYIDREKIFSIWRSMPAPASVTSLVAAISQTPAADVVEVRHGRWVWDTTGLYPKPICSRCGEEPYRRSNHTSDLPKYCPNCGARMGKEDEHEIG